LDIGGLRTEYGLKNKYGRSRHGQYKPYIEVQKQIFDVERPRLCTEDIRPPAFASKNVVSNNVPRHNGEFLEK
jgi:hypothetical protein